MSKKEGGCCVKGVCMYVGMVVGEARSGNYGSRFKAGYVR